VVGFILILMGVIFIGVGLFTGNVFSSAFSGFADVGADVGSLGSIFTLVFGGVGALLVVLGGISVFRGRQTGQLHKQILETGVDAAGEVTYVDKNYRILINNAPIYSIVEYKYRDSSGMEYVNRMDRISTESVVRSGIAVGSQIQIKYLSEDPSQSTIVPSA
jgi:hypothetical protein